MARRKPPKGCDRHHLCFTRKTWTSHYLWLLRNHWYMIVDIPLDLHKDLHATVNPVPVPSGESAKEAYEKLEYFTNNGVITPNDSITKRLAIIIGIFTVSEPPTAQGFSEQLDAVSNFYYRKR